MAKEFSFSEVNIAKNPQREHSFFHPCESVSSVANAFLRAFCVLRSSCIPHFQIFKSHPTFHIQIIIMEYRIEKDTMGEVKVPADKYWGAQTERSRNNFKIGPEASMPKEIIYAFGYLKKAAAMANHELGVLSADKKDLIAKVCDEIIAHKLDDQFPLVIWQTGSGTQSNMNARFVQVEGLEGENFLVLFAPIPPSPIRQTSCSRANFLLLNGFPAPIFPTLTFVVPKAAPQFPRRRHLWLAKQRNPS